MCTLRRSIKPCANIVNGCPNLARNSKHRWLDEGVMCPCFRVLTDNMTVRPAYSECLFYEVIDTLRTGVTLCKPCHAKERQEKRQEEAEKREQEAEKRERESEAAGRYHKGMQQN